MKSKAQSRGFGFYRLEDPSFIVTKGKAKRVRTNAKGLEDLLMEK